MRPFIPNLTEAFDVLDSQYRAHYLATDARQTSTVIAVWLIPVLFFAYAEYGLFGLSPRFAASLTLRLVFCLFSLYTISALLKVDTPRNYDYIFLRWAVLTTALILFFNYTWAPFVSPNGAITILILFSAYMVFPTSLAVRLGPALTLSAGNLVLQWRTAESLSPYSLLPTLMAIVMANVLGVIFSSSLHKHRYTEFKSRLDESRIKHELIRLASIDDLTGIFNRRKLIQLANEEFRQCSSQRQPFSVLMVDIDHFKKLNDKFGHALGDLLLSKFAAFVTHNLNTKHIWGRLGGDEFVLVLPGISGKEAKLIAEGLRLDLGIDPLIIWQGQPLTCTISIGLTERQEHDQSFEDTLRKADSALYHAKRNGRNRTEILW